MDDLPPGFRFYPTEEELISFYLHNKLQGTRQELDRVIPVVDIYDHDPSDLPQTDHVAEYSGELCRGGPEEWFFFSARQEREARGGRPSRTTSSGYWKATGSPSYVRSSSNQVIGMKKTMVFYRGRAPKGRKTKWTMNEFKKTIEVSNSINTSTPQLHHEFSLCRVYVKTGCLRAFDRRPTGTTASDATAPAHQVQAQAHGDDDVATASRHDQINPPPLMAPDQKTSSPESSSSGDLAPHYQTGESSTDWHNEEDFLLFSELEKLNWV